MKYLLRFCLLIAAVGAFTAVASADSLPLNSSSSTVTYVGYNTQNGNSTPTPFNYSDFGALTGTGFTAAGSSATVNITGTGVWTAAIPGSSWVSFEQSGPNCSGGGCPANGTYIFQSDLGDGYQDATISVLADDTTAIYLNGILIPGTPAGTASGVNCTSATPNCIKLSTFDLPAADFLSGDNTLTFAVEQLYNSGMGLDYQVNAAPEPSSLILLGTGLLGAAGALRRRLRS